jgi:hypothetical protein
MFLYDKMSFLLTTTQVGELVDTKTVKPLASKGGQVQVWLP